MKFIDNVSYKICFLINDDRGIRSHAYRNLCHVTRVTKTSNIIKKIYALGKQHQFMMTRTHWTFAFLRCYTWDEYIDKKNIELLNRKMYLNVFVYLKVFKKSRWKSNVNSAPQLWIMIYIYPSMLLLFLG